jgi:hypothetical protein
MQRRINWWVLVMAMVAVATPAPADAPTSSTGNGQLTAGGELRTFAYTAITGPDGNVKGQAQLYNRAQGNKTHISINCLNVVGNTAVVGGIVVKSTGGAFDNWTGVFAVQDNGEGNSDPADRLSLTFVYPPGSGVTCFTFPFASFPTMPIEGGNLQVRP